MKSFLTLLISLNNIALIFLVLGRNPSFNGVETTTNQKIDNLIWILLVVCFSLLIVLNMN